MKLNDIIYTLATDTVTLALFFAVVFFFRKQVTKPAMLLHFIIAFYIIETLSFLGTLLQVQLFPSLEYSWVSKLVTLIAVLVVYRIWFPDLFRQFGFTAPKNKEYLRWGIILVAGLIAFKFTTNYFSSDIEKITTENIIYQATLPGIQEEIIFRGLYLALLINAFSESSQSFLRGTGVYGVLLILLFALVHAVEVRNGFVFHFNVVLFFSSALAGWVYTWLRQRSGSLLPSIIGHNLTNLSISIAQLLK